MQRNTTTKQTTTLRSLQHVGLQVLFVGALLLISVPGSGATLPFPATTISKTEVTTMRALPASEGQVPEEMFREQSERLLRAVDRFLRTLAQNRSVRLTTTQDQGLRLHHLI